MWFWVIFTTKPLTKVLVSVQLVWTHTKLMGLLFVVVMLMPQIARLVLVRPAMKFPNVAHIIKVQLYSTIIVFWSTWADFFHQIDLQNQFFMTSTQNANDLTTFNRQTRELLSKLSKEATLTPELYAGGLLDLAGGDSKKLYGLVQCTRDLSSNNCFKCLDSIIAKLPSCNGKVGAWRKSWRWELQHKIRDVPFLQFLGNICIK